MLASDIIRRVRQIQIRTGRQVADILAGEYISVFKGGGIEFDEVRPYIPGDDIRSIDWNVTARTGEGFVKRYVEERQLNIMLLADVSASQDFGSQQRSKREAVAEFCALLAFSASQNDDKVGLLLFHSAIEQFIPPRKGQKHALRIVREVLAHGEEITAPLSPTPARSFWKRLKNRSSTLLRSARQGTNISQAIRYFISVSKRKTVCFVVSDFLDQAFEESLTLANQRHDVIAVLVTDPRESDIPPVGLISLHDAETGENRLFDTQSSTFRNTVNTHAAQRIKDLEKRLRRRGIDFIHIDISQSVVDPLVGFFRMRERRLNRG